MSMPAKIDAPDTTYEINIAGIAGKVVMGAYGVSLHGKWASHTGYRSEACGYVSDLSEAQCRELAMDHYDKQSEYAFAVGDDHRDMGWKKLSTDYRGRIAIRLPKWHEGIVAKTMETLGMEHTCPTNETWTFPADCGLTEALVRAVFAPILQKGTRFTDEAVLAQAIVRCVKAEGYLADQPLFTGAAQAELF